jgi:chaperonin GroEL
LWAPAGRKTRVVLHIVGLIGTEKDASARGLGWGVPGPQSHVRGVAGREEGAIVLGKVSESKDNNFGYNALTGEYEDLVSAGVLDPPKVVRTALINAGSIAALMLTTEALIAEIRGEKSSAGGTSDMH